MELVGNLQSLPGCVCLNNTYSTNLLNDYKTVDGDANPWRSCAYRNKSNLNLPIWNATEAENKAKDTILKMRGDNTADSIALNGIKFWLTAYSRKYCQNKEVNVGVTEGNTRTTTRAFWNITQAQLTRTNGYDCGILNGEILTLNGGSNDTNTFRRCIYTGLRNDSAYNGSNRFLRANMLTAITDSFNQLKTEYIDVVNEKLKCYADGYDSDNPVQMLEYCPAWAVNLASSNGILNSGPIFGVGSVSSSRLAASITSYVNVGNQIVQDAKTYGIHTFPGGCVHTKRTNVNETESLKFISNTVNPVGGGDLCAKVTSLFQAYATKTISKVIIIPSSSSLNNTANYYPKAFSKLSEDRANAILNCMRTNSITSSLFNPNGTSVRRDGEIAVEVRKGGINGDGTSGPCAYKCRDPIPGDSADACAEVTANVELAKLTENQRVYIYVGANEGTGGFAARGISASAAVSCYNIQLACNPVQPRTLPRPSPSQ